MATEKTWYMSGNVNLNGSSQLEVAQNFMFQLYNTLSGGNGNSDAKWEIVSASDGAGNIYSYGPALQPSDFVFNTVGANHSYFLARKDTLLPQTGSGTRYIYFYADCEETDATHAFFAFDHEPPGLGGTATNRPQETAVAYEKNTKKFITGYDAGFPTYYHSIIDTTGSWHVVTARGNVSYNPIRFAMSCARLETPRTGTVDPYPVFLKCGYADSTTYSGKIGGPWGIAYTSDGDYTDWNDVSGYSQAMWRTDGSTNGGNDDCLLLVPMTFDGWNGFNPQLAFKAVASPIDGTWPLLPTFVYTCNANVITAGGVRGRLPDIHYGHNQQNTADGAVNYANMNWLAGATVPATGTPTHAMTGQYWLPFSASLNPGLA